MDNSAPPSSDRPTSLPELRYWEKHGIERWDEIIVPGRFKNAQLGYVHSFCQERHGIDLHVWRSSVKTAADLLERLQPIVFKNGRFIDRTAKAIFALPWLGDAIKRLSACPSSNPIECFYWLVHGLTDYPKRCITCGKPVTRFISFNQGYKPDYCSRRCVNVNDVVWEKKKKTNLERYGTEHVLRSELVKSKIRKTVFERYGVNHNMHLESVLNRQLEAAHKRRDFTLPSGRVISLMGYEPDVLRFLLANGFTEDDFQFTGKPSIRYLLSNEERVYFPDFFIPSQRLIIEVKSLWTYFLDLEKNLAKRDWTIRAGWNYRLIVWDRDLGRELTPKEVEDGLSQLQKTRCQVCRKALSGRQRRFCSRRCAAASRETQLKRLAARGDQGFIDAVVQFVAGLGVSYQVDGDSIVANGVTLYLARTRRFQSDVRDSSRRGELLDIVRVNPKAVIIYQHDWHNNPLAWKTLIKSKLGCLKRFGARQVVILPIGANEARRFTNAYHVQGFCRAKVHLGAFLRGELVGVMSFDKPRFSPEADWELIRFTAKHAIAGLFSRMLARFRSENPGSIVSYADRSRSYGNVYLRCGFNLARETPPSRFYVRGTKVLTRFDVFERNLANVLERVDPALDVRENLANNGYKQVWNCGNLVFILK